MACCSGSTSTWSTTMTLFCTFGVATHGNALAIDDVLADFGDARVTELPIRPWWIVEMVENGR
jgi:hypothetical protein